MNALRKEEHFSHQTLDEALANAEKIKARQTYFTHMSHAYGLHEEMQQQLPPNTFIAYDGLGISFPDFPFSFQE